MIALTGASGLLGKFLLPRLIELDSVKILTRGEPTVDTHSGVQWMTGSLQDPMSLMAAFEGCHTVVHAAAVVSFSPKHRHEMFNTNVEGTANVVDACLAVGVRRLVLISSVAALGRQPGQTVIDESAKWTGSELNTFYGQSKHKAELEALRGQEEGLSVAIVNPSVILAPSPDRSSGRIFRYVWDGAKFYTPGTGNFVDVRDVCDVVTKVVQRPETAGRFIASGGQLTWKHLFEEIAGHFGKRPPRWKVTAGWIRVAVWVEAFRSRLTGREPLVTKETAEMASTAFLYSNRRASVELGVQFRTISESIAWCCKTLLDQKALSE
ncbi:MAG: NAD-dependent epimerase/dehydratase family protein [Cyclobacteriaceae bacterium]|nr:NAD-dependent epimerase/dehydratase family protein [Cyclobacteriaceae bacterium]